MNNFMKRLLVAMFSVGLAVCLGASSSVNAAEVRQEPVISIAVKDMPLREFVAEVEKKCSYTFFYSVQVLEQAGKVTVNAENEPVGEVLKKALAGTGCTFEVIGNKIAIKTDTSLKLADANIAAKSQTVTEQSAGTRETRIVSGVVRDSEGKPLPGVGVFIVGTTTGVITDNDGAYSIKVAAGQELRFSSMGYKDETVKVGSRSEISVRMMDDAQVLESVVVTAFGMKRDEKSLGYAATKVDGGNFSNAATSSNWVGGLAGKVAGLGVVADGDGVLAVALHIDGAVRADDAHRVARRVCNFAFAGEVGQRAVARHDPFGIRVNRHVRRAAAAVPRTGLVIDYRAGKHASLRHIQIEVGNAVPNHVAVHLLVDSGEGAVRAVRAGLAPAALFGVARAAQEVFAVIRGNLDVREHELALGVGGIEDAAVAGDERAALHLKAALANLGVAGHALVEDDRPGVNVLLKVGHIARQVAVVQADGIQAFETQRFGACCRQRCFMNRDIRRHIHRRRAHALGDIRAAVHDHRAAAAVGTDRRGGFALRRHGQILGVERAAASDVNAAGGILRGRDGRIAHHRHAVAVGEHARAALCVGGHRAIRNGDCAAGGQHRRAHAVKAGLIAARALVGIANDG